MTARFAPVADGGMGVSPVQVCRTCAKAGDRINVSARELAAARKAGTDLEELKCQPWKSAEHRAIRSDRSMRSTAALASGAVPVTIGPKPQVVAFTDTCGQVVLDKCRTCTHFSAVEARIPGKGKNGQAVTIGGHCRIAAEGIMVSGQRKYCVKVQRDFDILSERRNCDTCQFQTSFGNDRMLDHASPLLGDISRYEMGVLRNSLADEEIAAGIAEARRLRGLVIAPVNPHSKRTSLAPKGFIKFYSLDVVKIYEGTRLNVKGKSEVVPIAADVRIPGLGDIVRFALNSGDDSEGMLTLVSTTRAVLEITAPHHRKYGLPDNDKIDIPARPNDRTTCPTCHGKAVSIVSGPDGVKITEVEAGRRGSSIAVINRYANRWEALRCSLCGGTGKIGKLPKSLPVPKRNLGSRVHSMCMECRPDKHKPCYWHAKAPVETEVTLYHPTALADGTIKTEIERRRTIDCQDPLGLDTPMPTSDIDVRLIRHDGHVEVVDMVTMGAPDFFRFRLRYRSLFDQARNAQERREVMRAFVSAKNKVEGWKRNVLLDLSWALPAPADPWHRQCEVNLFDTMRRPGHVARRDVWVPITAGSAEEEIDTGTARGIDFEHAWRDWFGLERGAISTNPVFGGGWTGFGIIYGITRKDGTRAKMARGLRLDERFSLPKYQEQEDWLRIHKAGEQLQDEILANEHLWMMRRGQHFVGMPPETIVTQLDPGIPGSNLTFESTQALLDWLGEIIWIPGTADSSGFHARRKWATLGYDDFRGTRPMRDDDIPSVWAFRSQLNTEDATLGENSNAVWICTSCYDPTSGDAGQFSPEEIDNADLSCPNPECDGKVVWYERRPEELQGHLRTDPDQMGDDETYRRRSGSPDTAEWLTRDRLRTMVCPYWTPRG